MDRIVISGYYGFNNVGDESILTSIVGNLKEYITDVEITVLSANPEGTSKKHQIQAVDRKNILEICRAIKKCDLFISGGGSLLQDVTSGRSISYYLAIILIALFLRKKVLIYSQGMGPINKWFNKCMVRWVLNRVDCITIRDEKSKKVLDEVGVCIPKIYVTTDPVISLHEGNISLGKEILIKEGINYQKPLIGFAIRGRDDNEEFVSNISTIADQIIEDFKVDIVFVPFHFGEDVKIMDKIQNKMKQKAFFIQNRYNIDEMLGIVGNLNLLIGVRLHSLIFSAVMNTPLIAISYDPKIDSFMESLQLKTLCSIENLNYKALHEEINYIQKNYEQVKNILEKRVQKLRDKLKTNEKVVIELLKGGHSFEK
ncbi:polysaccharide pyruvyl transferase CsaB [Inediibacterium massiliense]|uniref:polysaccharide pyruvyl transferase CsaB n=1 Tax=Inediibacterium massiliense TaxID=1658111 RepID=UPI0006B61887|nr:polysaccharide pyruvyl transferase CsaB [Inediibacterium massiliense]